MMPCLCTTALAQDAAQAQPAAPDAASPAEPAAADTETKEPAAGDPWGNDHDAPRAGPIVLRGLLQTRYSQAWSEHSDNAMPGYALRERDLAHDGDGWKLNRFFLRIGADATPWLGFRSIVDFAQLSGGSASGTVKQAYVDVQPWPKHLELYAGLFKLPFSTLELDPIADYELAELGPSDDLVKDLGFAGRDIGAQVVWSPLQHPKQFRVSIGAFRGKAHDEHASPLGAVGARIEGRPFKGLRIGADVVDHPFDDTYERPFETSSKEELPTPPDPLYPNERRWTSGAASSADVTFDRWHVRLRGEGMLGKRVDYYERYGASTFAAAWFLAAYRFHTGPIELMPAARAEWLDADRRHSVGQRLSLSGGLDILFTKQLRLLFDVTRTDVQHHSPVLDQPKPLPGIPYFELSSTRVTGQVQVTI